MKTMNLEQMECVSGNGFAQKFFCGMTASGIGPIHGAAAGALAGVYYGTTVGGAVGLAVGLVVGSAVGALIC